MAAINPVVDFGIEDGVAVISVNAPPVNALTHAVRVGVIEAARMADADPTVKAVALLCEGRTYFAGFDIAEFDAGIRQPLLNAMIESLELCGKPVVTGLHGTALGGGLETALGCHYRLAVPSAKMGLPEIHLGLLPAAGGTQRLPRIVGAERALEIIIGGRPMSAAQALEAGIIDGLVEEGTLRERTIAFAREVAGRPGPLPRIRDRQDRILADRSHPDRLLAATAAVVQRHKGLDAPAGIVEAVKAAVELPFRVGLEREYDIFVRLCEGDQSRALRYSFFAEREAAKVPGLARDQATLPVASVGVVGAGTMGTGIAMNFLSAGLPVTLVEASQAALDRGVGIIRGTYEASVAKGRIAADDLERCMGLLRASLAMDDLAPCDLVIEAVYENLEVKRSVFATLDKLARPGAILASNTSFLDLDAIAAATRRPGSVVGMHFFSPAHVMKMLEVVRGRATDDAVLATVMKVARQIGKVAVVTGVCHGFIANRIFEKRQAQADRLLLEGALPWEVDRVAVEYGFPMGPFAMMDLVGLDVIGWDRANSAGRSVVEILNEAGRHGQKSGLGYYDYDEKRRPTPSRFTADAIAGFAASRGILRRAIGDEEIAERLLYPMVREAIIILEERIALRASDIDVAVQYGYGWPRHRGGPMFEADRLGAADIVRRLDALASRFGADFQPTDRMRMVAREGGMFRDMSARA